ncbi:hypothetical protein ACFV1L_16745 [Kitasatospora sp. NPDC059646]|uniref:hypothetical protein n=1 Tax=Kitasatospora sp. NPDC059646 TaxID=3346893 RepID=UPI0036908860
MGPYLITLAVLVGVLTPIGLGLHAVRRRGGVAAAALSGALAGYEEAVRATSYAAHAELLAEADRKAPIEAPGGRFDGRALLADGAGRSGPGRRPGRGAWRTVRAWWRRG